MSENNHLNEQNNLETNGTPYQQFQEGQDRDRDIDEQAILLENRQPEMIIQSAEEIRDEIKETDRQLETFWYSAYRTWVGIFMVISLIASILGMVETFIVKFAYVYLVGVFGCLWNTKHLYEEYQAIAYRDIVKANKAMQSIKAFIVVMPLLFLFAAMIEGLQVLTVVFGILGIVVIFYFLVGFGAQITLAKLQQREELKKKLVLLMK